MTTPGKSSGISAAALDEKMADDAIFRHIVEMAPDALIVVDGEGHIRIANAQVEKLFGYTRAELLGQPIECLVPERSKAVHEPYRRKFFSDASARPMGQGTSIYGRHKDGHEFPVEISLSTMISESGALVSAVIRDVSERNATQEALFAERERAAIALNSIGDGVLCIDTAGLVTYLNPVAERMTGWSCSKATGRPFNEVFSIVDAAHTHAENPLELTLANDAMAGLEVNSFLRRRDGHETPIEDSAAPIHDRAGQVTGAVIVFHDVSQARMAALKMQHIALHDALTALPNRALMLDLLKQAIAAAQRRGSRFAVLFLDLDRFKSINDSLGHAIGDQLLCLLAGRLVGSVRQSDIVSRQGGDEFIIVLSDIKNEEDVAASAQKILKAITSPCHLSECDLVATASLGISIYPEDGSDADTLMRNADTAMYTAKSSGRNTFQFFRPEMNARLIERQFIEQGLRRALERSELVLHYQSKIDLNTGAIVGVEALVRWQHPERGLIGPAEFIPVAEDCGLIDAVDRWVLREACGQMRAWLDMIPPLQPPIMAINISAMELRSPHFVEQVSAALAESRLPAHRLNLELTESTLMQKESAANDVLKSLKTLGVQLAIDDFGTGYSNLNYLHRFEIDELKIDQSFVCDIDAADSDATIVNAVIAIGQSFGQRVVAEGIETRAQFEFLRARHCPVGQGFYWGKPLDAKDFTRMLQGVR